MTRMTTMHLSAERSASPLRTGSALNGRIPAWTWLAAIAVPWCIGLSFSHPTPRVIVPESLMLLVVVVITFAGGVLPGVTTAVNSMVALWICSLPPGLTVRLSSRYDVIAVVACGVVATAMALTVTWLRMRELTAAARTQAVEQARQSDLDLITELQRAILPEAPTTVEGVSFGCSYLAGGTAGPVGGDWYAFIPFEDGRVGMAVGDVVGHGVPAISVMAEYRFTLRTLAARGESPDLVLDELELLSRRLRRTSAFTTCVYAVIDPAAGTCTFANAGHPPPILVRDRVAHVLDLPHGPPIGTMGRDTPSYVSHTVSLRAGDTIILYTDGLVERRREVLDVGIDRLRRRASDITGALVLDAGRLIADMVGDQSYDDAAVVLARLDRVLGMDVPAAARQAAAN